MKRFFALAICFILVQASLLAQSETFPEGLRKLTNKEMMDVMQSPPKGLTWYDVEGNKLSEKLAQGMTQGGDFVPEYYANADGKVVAVKFRKVTEQEKAMFASFRAEQERLATLVGTEAKDFETVDMDGNSIKLSDLKGEVVAINFWFVGCKPCIMEMPELNEIVKEFEGEEVKFVAIALDSKGAIEKFQEKHSFDYNIVPDGRKLAKHYEVSGYPTHCIVDKEGKIAYFKSAYSPMTATEITHTLEKLLK